MNLDKIIADKEFRIYDNGTVLKCLGRCLNDGYFPLNIDDVRELRNKKVISKNQCHDTSTVRFDGVQRDATLDELKNIKDFYKKGGCVLYIFDRDSFGVGSVNFLDNDGCFVGVPLTNVTDAQKFKEYDDVLKFMQSDKGREYLINNPDKTMGLYKALGPALMKMKN